ncbi:MAG TPA: HAD-IIIA family hydrolase [Longimicrobiales bacterium]|nr:HAD-IIIA family hydrolase [Longimicrobiales bacterium]
MTDLRPAVFLDRDGTLIVERSYLADPDAVALVPGVPSALADLRSAGLALVTVTNQSGIARGLYTEEEYRAVAARIDEILTEAGAPVDATEYCPHHPDVTGPCDCRKPGTGMHRRAAAALGLDLARSYYVGDKVTDVLPARELGGQGILVRTGYGREQEGSAPEGTWVAEDLREAADLILGRRGPAGG